MIIKSNIVMFRGCLIAKVILSVLKVLDPSKSPLRDFQIKKYPKISCGAGIWPC